MTGDVIRTGKAVVLADAGADPRVAQPIVAAGPGPAVAAELTGRAADVVQLAREALSNVSRHAEAATCRVSLYRDEGGVVLEVDDDGRGFDPATGTGQGLATCGTGREPGRPGRDPERPRRGHAGPGADPPP